MSTHSWNDVHIVRTSKALLKALSVTLACFLLFFVVFHIGGALYVSSLVTRSSDAFSRGIATDFAYLKNAGDMMAESAVTIDSLRTQNSDQLLQFIREQSEKYGIKTIGVTNAEGVVVSRTKKLGVKSDNVFLTVPEGQIVAQGKSVEAIGQAILTPRELRMSTGRPVLVDGVMAGGLFTTHSMDDEYAARFKKAYLPVGTEVVFYTKEFGVYGDSVEDLSIRNAISSYFNPGSEWIHDSVSGKTISFDNEHFYYVKNIVFPGITKDTGGALLFIPRRDVSNVTNIAIAVLTVLIFIVLAVRHHLRSRGEERGWRYYTFLIAVAIPVFGFAYVGLHLENIGYLKLEHIPYTLYNSTLRLQPEFGIYNTDSEQKFSIVVDTGDEAINAVQIGLVFDPKVVEVKGFEAIESTCTYVIESEVDVDKGIARFSCALLKQNGERGSLSVADIVVIPKKPGTFTLSFDSEETKVLANDGLGTDVLRMSQSGSYQVDDFDSSVSGVLSPSFIVFSPTHPNQSRWYSASTARFLWRGSADDVYRYAFDTNPNTVPSIITTTKGTSVDLRIPGDGIFYFHLQLAKGGPVTHYRVQADSTPPSITAIHLSSKNITVGDVVRFSFEGQDAGSGIQQNYYVDAGNHLFLPTGSQLFIPFLEPGDQRVTLRVYDDANNYSEKTEIIHVDEPR